MNSQDDGKIELATGAQLYRMNQLGILPERTQITKEEASAVLSEARSTGKWPKERPDIGRPWGGPLRRPKRKVGS